MKRILIGILCLWLLSGSVSAQKYFPDHAFDNNEELNQFKVDWYSKDLKALGEPSLWELSQKSKQEVYRFLWLRSFHHPIAVRVEVEADGSGVLTVKETNGAGGYEPGKLIKNRTTKISKERLNYFLGIVEDRKYWDIPTNPPPPDGGTITVTLDGAQWIVEATRNGRYKVVDRTSPHNDPIRTLGLWMMLELANLPLLYREVY